MSSFIFLCLKYFQAASPPHTISRTPAVHSATGHPPALPGLPVQIGVFASYNPPFYQKSRAAGVLAAAFLVSCAHADHIFPAARDIVEKPLHQGGSVMCSL